MISPTLRLLPDNIQHSQETDNYATGGIQTRNPSKRLAPDPRLRPRGHWDRHSRIIVNGNSRSIDVDLNTPATTSSVTTKRSNNYHNSHLFCNIFFVYTTNVSTFFHLTSFPTFFFRFSVKLSVCYECYYCIRNFCHNSGLMR